SCRMEFLHVAAGVVILYAPLTAFWAFLYDHDDIRDFDSFPTRRSSDLMHRSPEWPAADRRGTSSPCNRPRRGAARRGLCGRRLQIGRASCRERVSISEVGVSRHSKRDAWTTTTSWSNSHYAIVRLTSAR